jgi:hypothetical protein
VISEDAVHDYLDNVIVGVSIREIARRHSERLGRLLHPSTVLRRIQKVEDFIGEHPMVEELVYGESQGCDKEVEIALRRLSEPGAILVVGDTRHKKAVVMMCRDPDNPVKIAEIGRGSAAKMIMRGQVVRQGNNSKFMTYVVTSRGKDELRRALQVQRRSRPSIVCESPLGRLLRSKHIDRDQYATGVRFREMHAAGDDLSHVERALGRELWQVLQDVVIAERGLATVEKDYGYPARSAKVLVHVALLQLASVLSGELTETVG